MQVVKIGSATLIRGDSRDVLPTLGRFDSLITDPPFGVDFKGKADRSGKGLKGQRCYIDDEVNFRSVVLPIVKMAIAQSERAAIFPGTRRLQEYPLAKDIGGIARTCGPGWSSWGFNCLSPILFYGKSPYLARGMGCRPTATLINLRAQDIERVLGHPCPKPTQYMLWTVKTASLEGDLVCDPFMGSGTTAIAAIQLGRRFVGIELDPTYFRLACARVRAAVAGADTDGCTQVGRKLRERRKVGSNKARIPLGLAGLQSVVRTARHNAAAGERRGSRRVSGASR